MGYPMCLSGYLDPYPVLFQGDRCVCVSITHSLSLTTTDMEMMTDGDTRQRLNVLENNPSYFLQDV